MASLIKNLSDHDPATVPSGEDFVIGIIVSDYHTDITYSLRNACVRTLIQYGVKKENIIIEYVPGAYELTFGAAAVYVGSDCEAVIALGCVIKGDTDHDVYINQSVSHGLTELTLEYSAPFIFGLLTVNTLEQAQDRAGGKHGNKGEECAIAALKTLAMQRRYDGLTDGFALNN